MAQIEPASAEAAAKTVPVLIAGLAHSVPKYRQGAAESLGNLGPLAKDALAELQKTVKEDPDPAVRQAAAQAVEKIGQADRQERARCGREVHLGGQHRGDVAGRRASARGTEAIARLPKGTQLKVLSLAGDWVGVQAEIGGQPKSGWVQKTQVGLP